MLNHPPLVWAEIAVSDMDRAIKFYQQHFNVNFKRETIDDMEMAILETKNDDDTNLALVKHKMLTPSMDGSTIYLHFSEQLTPLVEKLQQANVPVLVPATPIKDGECGYIALFGDSEGNKVGLWANNL